MSSPKTSLPTHETSEPIAAQTQDAPAKHCRWCGRAVRAGGNYCSEGHRALYAVHGRNNAPVNLTHSERHSRTEKAKAADQAPKPSPIPTPDLIPLFDGDPDYEAKSILRAFEGELQEAASTFQDRLLAVSSRWFDGTSHCATVFEESRKEYVASVKQAIDNSVDALLAVKKQSDVINACEHYLADHADFEKIVLGIPDFLWIDGTMPPTIRGVEDACNQVNGDLRQYLHFATSKASRDLNRQHQAQKCAEAVNFSHEPGYRTIRWNDKEYGLTPKQATIVKLLYEAYQSHTPAVGKDRLLAAVEAETSRVRDFFKNSLLWNKLIISGGWHAGGRRGTYWLNLK